MDGYKLGMELCGTELYVTLVGRVPGILIYQGGSPYKVSDMERFWIAKEKLASSTVIFLSQSGAVITEETAQYVLGFHDMERTNCFDLMEDLSFEHWKAFMSVQSRPATLALIHQHSKSLQDERLAVVKKWLEKEEIPTRALRLVMMLRQLTFEKAVAALPKN